MSKCLHATVCLVVYFWLCLCTFASLSYLGQTRKIHIAISGDYWILRMLVMTIGADVFFSTVYDTGLKNGFIVVVVTYFL